MNNYPIPYKNRNRVAYKYRSISGVDVSVEEIGDRGETIEQIKAKIVKDHSSSVTPVTEIDGVAVDLTEFLTVLREEALAEVEDAKEYLRKIDQEIKRRGAGKNS